MATSGRIETGRYNGTCFYFQWQLGGQDVGTNRSVIHWQVGINITNNARWYSNAVRLNITTVNGSGNIASGVWSNISGNGDHQLGGGIMDIYHNSDGQALCMEAERLKRAAAGNCQQYREQARQHLQRACTP